MEANEYRCVMCGNVYTKAISDEEAMQETSTHWPSVAQQDCAVVCDDCYQSIAPEQHPQEYRASEFEMEILRAFAIPPALLGDVSNTNYHHGDAELRAYIRRFFKDKQ